MAITAFPGTAVCYILTDIPGIGELQGSGVIIGPHTILTASHLVYDADTGHSADAVSVYPGYVPTGSTGDPAGALGGLQSIHYNKVPDGNESLSPAGTQYDFAVIDTSTDLGRFGRFALDPDFGRGDVIVDGYPASNGGYQAGAEGVVAQSSPLSDIGTSSLPLSPGYSGGPLWDKVVRGVDLVPAVVGVVSTDGQACKLNRNKVALIRHWIAADRSLYAGGQDAPRGLVPQLAGTVSDAVDAAAGPSGAQHTLAAFAQAAWSGPAGPAHAARAAHAAASPFDAPASRGAPAAGPFGFAHALGGAAAPFPPGHGWGRHA